MPAEITIRRIGRLCPPGMVLPCVAIRVLTLRFSDAWMNVDKIL